MTGWERALEKFLEPWRRRPDVVGALVCGSRVLGTATKRSDVDVHIVLSNRARWRERGNRVVDGYLIEYFINPTRQLKRYRLEDWKNGRRIDARMYGMGRILFDRTGALARIQAAARVEMQRPFKPVGRIGRELAKYHIWDELDGLEDLYERRAPGFWHQFHLALSGTVRAYSRTLGVETPPSARLRDYLTDARFRRRYGLGAFPDRRFATLVVRCLDVRGCGAAISEFRKLVARAHDRMGGFRIDGWKLWSPAAP